MWCLKPVSIRLGQHLSQRATDNLFVFHLDLLPRPNERVTGYVICRWESPTTVLTHQRTSAFNTCCSQRLHYSPSHLNMHGMINSTCRSMRAGSPELAFRVRSPDSAPVSRESRCTVGLRGAPRCCGRLSPLHESGRYIFQGTGRHWCAAQVATTSSLFFAIVYGATRTSRNLDKFRCSSNLMAMPMFTSS